MMRVFFVGLRNAFEQILFHRQRCFALRQAEAMRETKDVGIYRHRGFTKRRVQDNIGGFSSDTGEGFKGFPLRGNLPLMPFQ